jgi:DNA-binding LacI/PurR family transcriptional regulator
MERAGISEIASRLNLSKTTVSRVFNNTPNSRISDSTRKKVLTAVKEMGYEPNLSARALAKSRTHIIGVMFININSQFVNAFVDVTERQASEKGYHVLLCNSRGDPEREKEHCRMLHQRGAEGMIIEHVGTGEHLRELMARGYPIVLTGRCHDAPEVDFAGFDEVEGGKIATRALIEAERKRIAIMTGGSGVGGATDRLAGYRLAMTEAGLARNPAWEIMVDRYEDLTTGREAGARLLKGHEQPDAVFCHDDIMAMGVRQAAITAGLRVPEDLAIIGYGDNYNTAWAQIPLPSIHLDTGKLGEETCRILLDRIEHGSSEPQQALIKPYLVRSELLRKT